MIYKILLSLFCLSALNSNADQDQLWWCTSIGFTLEYKKELVWGQDQYTHTEAKADALATCRTYLYQCRIVECMER